MQSFNVTFFRLYVLRAGSMTAFNAEEIPNLREARAAAERLSKPSEHYPAGNYVEIRRHNVETTVKMIERFEPV